MTKTFNKYFWTQTLYYFTSSSCCNVYWFLSFITFIIVNLTLLVKAKNCHTWKFRLKIEKKYSNFTFPRCWLWGWKALSVFFGQVRYTSVLIESSYILVMNIIISIHTKIDSHICLNKYSTLYYQQLPYQALCT